MPHIIKTSTRTINITSISLLGLLEQSNSAAHLLRAAGIEPASVCLCPAIKLVANIKIMEEHGLNIPEFLTVARMSPPSDLVVATC